MIVTSTLLSPDDTQQDTLNLVTRQLSPAQPYGLAAIMLGLLLLLVLHIIFTQSATYELLPPVLLTVLLAYILMYATRPQLPLHAFCMLASILGMLYSLPVKFVYYQYWQNMLAHLLVLLWLMVVAGTAGYTFAHWLHVEEQPREVLGVSFMFTFVVD